MRWNDAFSVFGALALAISVSKPALACGGTFCDLPRAGQPPPMPVDQSGENIVFVLADGFVEAHIQIQYKGDPQRFAWLVPVPARPEVSVGSQQLFVNLMNATVPTFSLSTRVDSCNGSSANTTQGSSGAGCGFGSSSASASFDGVGRDGGGNGPELHSDTVVAKQAVGAFDVTVLEPTSVSDVTAWLDANGFLQDYAAPPILADYVASGHFFVAVKLQPGAGVDEIHPLVVRYPGTSPCIPLKLTAIAATEDMAVRAFFLGDRRVVPTTYMHATLNPVALDWIAQGANYTSVVSRAVDEPGADGQAFITEYAGTSAIVPETSLAGSAWASDVFRTIDPTGVIDELSRQGLVSCARSASCQALHPLVLPIVERYLPAPAGMREGDFYSCLSCNAASVNLGAWDGNAFADELEARVIAPGRHAVDILRGATYATRLFTTVSPYEMTKDPEFAAASLSEGPVSATLAATRRFTCSGAQAVQLQDGREVALDAAATVPRIEGMPLAETIEQFDTNGHPTPIANNSKAIDESVTKWNESVGYDPNAPQVNRAGSGSGCGSSPDSSSSSSGGCACGIPKGRRVPPYMLGGALVLGVLRRQKRRQPSVNS